MFRQLVVGELGMELVVFFFQAEDGIRDLTVTGVQTCALPILMAAVSFAALKLKLVVEPGGAAALAAVLSGAFDAGGKTIAIVLSGGNIDPDMLQRCLTAAPSP